MVNRSFADRYFPNQRVIGLHLKRTRPIRITGVVGDARELGPIATRAHRLCVASPPRRPSPGSSSARAASPRAAIGAIRMKLEGPRATATGLRRRHRSRTGSAMRTRRTAYARCC
jgi:hypothetical protein